VGLSGEEAERRTEKRSHSEPRGRKILGKKHKLKKKGEKKKVGKKPGRKGPTFR